MMKKRILSLLMALVLCLSLLPTMAFAKAGTYVYPCNGQNKLQFNSDDYVVGTAKWGDYTFDGWYDSMIGGNKVTPVDSPNGGNYFAHWKNAAGHTVLTGEIKIANSVITLGGVTFDEYANARMFEDKYGITFGRDDTILCINLYGASIASSTGRGIVSDEEIIIDTCGYDEYDPEDTYGDSAISVSGYYKEDNVTGVTTAIQAPGVEFRDNGNLTVSTADLDLTAEEWNARNVAVDTGKNKNVVFDTTGNVTITTGAAKGASVAKSYGVCADGVTVRQGNITVSSGDVSYQTTGEIAKTAETIAVYELLEMKGGKLSASAGKVLPQESKIGTAVYSMSNDCLANIIVTNADESAVSNALTQVDTTKPAVVTYNTKYPLWIANDIQVTELNKDDVLGDADGAAKTVSFDPETNTLTLNNAKIAAGEEDRSLRGISSGFDKTLTIKLIGTNVIGRAADWDLTGEVGYEKYAVSVGLSIAGQSMMKKKTSFGDVTFVGDRNSSLTIYDYQTGIEAKNVTFGDDYGSKFSGTLTVCDYGGEANCAITAEGSVTTYGGTLSLTSKNSNGIIANGINVYDGSEITVNAATETIGGADVGGLYGISAGQGGELYIQGATVNVNAGNEKATVQNGCYICGLCAETIGITSSKVTANAKGDVTATTGDARGSAIGIKGYNKTEEAGMSVQSPYNSSSKAEVVATGIGSYGVGIDLGDSCAWGLSVTDATVKAKGSTYAILTSAFSEYGESALTITSYDTPLMVQNAQMMTALTPETFAPVTEDTEKYDFFYTTYPNFGDLNICLLKAASDTVDNGYVTIGPKQSDPTPSSSGGSSTPTVTVPVSGDKDSVKISATVRGSTATVKNITEAQLDKVGTDREVTIDLSGLKKSVTGVTIPKTTLENVAASEASGLEVKLPNGTTAVFDKTTVAAIAEQAAGSDIQLVVDPSVKAQQALTGAQKNAIKDFKNALVLDAYFVSNGKRISDFKGGEAELTVAYPTTKPVRVWYVAEDGTTELIPSTFDGKAASFVVRHFSHYVIEQLDGSSYASCPQDATCVYAYFTDADTKAWYHDGVHYCVDNGLMSGVGNDLFAPGATLTRGMVVTMLWRLDGEPIVNYAMTFKDVPASEWYTEAVRWAAAEKIVSGYDAEHFGPNDPVTREQLAAILYNYAKHEGQGFTGSWMFLLDFVDRADISSWADEAVHWCSMKGVISGKDGKVFDPQGNATRAEAASMFQRLGEKVLAK